MTMLSCFNPFKTKLEFTGVFCFCVAVTNFIKQCFADDGIDIQTWVLEIYANSIKRSVLCRGITKPKPQKGMFCRGITIPSLGCLDTKVIEFLSDSLMLLLMFVGCVSCTMYIQLKRFCLQT